MFSTNSSPVSPEAFRQQLRQAEAPVIVWFHSDDCLPCTTFAPLYERLAAEYADRAVFLRVHRTLNRAVAEAFAVKSSPTLVFFHDGEEACARLTGYISWQEASTALETLIGRRCPTEPRPLVRCDVLIVGAGPAGLTAAIYAARARLYTVVLDSSLPGGQVATTFTVANYPGVSGVVRGIDLMENMKNQALSFGAQIDDLQEIVSVSLEGGTKTIRTAKGDYEARVVIIATGAEPKKLPVEGERDYRSRGIHYCATCDGAMYQEAEVMVVGGGVSALEEAEFLTRYARRVAIVNRGRSFKAPRAMVEQAENNPAIEMLWNSVIAEVKGESFVTAAVLEDTETGERRERPVEGIFVYIGSQPNSSVFGQGIRTDERGFIRTDEGMMTSIPGVFAAGDIREKDIRQITTAVSDGTIAAVMAERWITNRAASEDGWHG